MSPFEKLLKLTHADFNIRPEPKSYSCPVIEVHIIPLKLGDDGVTAITHMHQNGIKNTSEATLVSYFEHLYDNANDIRRVKPPQVDHAHLANELES